MTLDLHHHFSGMLADDAFEHVWPRRVEVALADQPVHTVGVPDALIIESLNSVKLLGRTVGGSLSAGWSRLPSRLSLVR